MVFSLRPSATSTTLRPLYDPPSPLRPSVPYTALCPLYGPLTPLWPFTPTALYPLYGPLSILRPSVSSTAFCPFYKTCFFSLFREMIILFCCFAKRGPRNDLFHETAKQAKWPPFVSWNSGTHFAKCVSSEILVKTATQYQCRALAIPFTVVGPMFDADNFMGEDFLYRENWPSQLAFLAVFTSWK